MQNEFDIQVSFSYVPSPTHGPQKHTSTNWDVVVWSLYCHKTTGKSLS